jgi:hypothetical protein
MTRKMQQTPDAAGNAIRLSRIAEELTLTCVAPPEDDLEVGTGFASDVLSEVLARAPQGCLLVTAQNNLNVIAVAAYTHLAGVIVTSGYQPGEEVLAKAREEGIGLYTTPAQTFDVVGRLARLGVQGPATDFSRRTTLESSEAEVSK